MISYCKARWLASPQGRGCSHNWCSSCRETSQAGLLPVSAQPLFHYYVGSSWLNAFLQASWSTFQFTGVLSHPFLMFNCTLSKHRERLPSTPIFSQSTFWLQATLGLNTIVLYPSTLSCSLTSCPHDSNLYISNKANSHNSLLTFPEVILFFFPLKRLRWS